MLSDTVHRTDIGDIDDDRLVAQMLKRCVHEVEVDALDQHVRRDKQLLLAPFDHGGVVADAFDRRAPPVDKGKSQVVDQPKFTEFVDVRAVILLRHVL